MSTQCSFVFGFFSVGALFIGNCFVNMGDVLGQKSKLMERVKRGFNSAGVRCEKEDGKQAQTGKVGGYELLELTSHKNY